MDARFDELRDRLISLLPGTGAVKIQPMLDDAFARALDSATFTKEQLQEKTREEIHAMTLDSFLAVEGLEKDLIALAQAEDAKFIEQIRVELQIDPDGVGYGGMNSAEIALEMAREHELREDRDGPSAMQGIIDRVLNGLAVRPTNIAIDAKGRILSSGFDGLQALLDAAIDVAGGDRDVLAQPAIVSVIREVKPAPYWRVAAGVKHARAVVRVEEIERARA